MEKWIFPTVLTYPELLQAIQNISESYAAINSEYDVIPLVYDTFLGSVKTFVF